MVRAHAVHEKHQLPTLLGNGRQVQTLSGKNKAHDLSETKGLQASPGLQSSSGPPPMSEAEQELMRAVFGEDVKKARELLCEHGASLLSGNGCGITSTAILYAAEAGNVDMCELLVAHGGVEVFNKGFDVHKLGPADYAEKGGHPQLALHLKAMESRVRKRGSKPEKPNVPGLGGKQGFKAGNGDKSNRLFK
eukprot:gnl/MRDRNA2_/MRDRNA2_73842_c0_seq1.p1 gnl/MRDRNA2_/MRDRNA2_73842_c0~~gnl/MRDRNA2_/MRDRNA2_73842_c0_seq1.p1  ORF type:complete len:215 (+),score=48.35 gnl/MRDRNA2_/MRDRNA2_73842_c0_seq1:71-646(+)